MTHTVDTFIQSQTRNVLLEFNKGLNIKSCYSWFKSYTGEIKGGLVSSIGIDRKRYTRSGYKIPTLRQNGFNPIFDNVWGDVAKWSNKDIVIYVMKKRGISNKSEVLYNIKKEPFSRNKSVQLFYKIP